MGNHNRAAFGPIGLDAASFWEHWIEEEIRFWLEENPNTWFPRSYSIDNKFRFGIDPGKLAKKNGWTHTDGLMMDNYRIPIETQARWTDKGLTRKKH